MKWKLYIIIGKTPAESGTKAEKENNVLQISNLEFNYYWDEIGIENFKVDCNKRIIFRIKAGDPLPNTRTFFAIRQQNSDGEYVETEYIENQNYWSFNYKKSWSLMLINFKEYNTMI